ncbi:MAG: hypothetical protein ABIH53_02160 [archaeon]
MGLSNKTLIVLVSLILALFIFSITVTFSNIDNTNLITGKSVATGSVNITVGSTLEINLTSSSLQFGKGAVSIGNDTCLLGTNRTTQPGCLRWESKPVGLVIENIGNTYTRVNITNTNYSSSFFAGTDSDKAGYAIRITTPQGNDTTCTGLGPDGTIVLEANRTWYNITEALNESNMLCASLNYSNLADTVQIDFLFSIPNTTNFGNQSDIWTIVATAI